MPRFIAVLRHIYVREMPPDPRVWHRRNLFWPVRCINGEWAIDVWRRQTSHGWEYQPRPETYEERLDRQW